jgi:hypothetical protein
MLSLMSNPSSCNGWWIHIASQQQFANDWYSNSHVECETKFCFQQHHEMGGEPTRKA